MKIIGDRDRLLDATKIARRFTDKSPGTLDAHQTILVVGSADNDSVSFVANHPESGVEFTSYDFKVEGDDDKSDMFQINAHYIVTALSTMPNGDVSIRNDSSENRLYVESLDSSNRAPHAQLDTFKREDDYDLPNVGEVPKEARAVRISAEEFAAGVSATVQNVNNVGPTSGLYLGTLDGLLDGRLVFVGGSQLAFSYYSVEPLEAKGTSLSDFPSVLLDVGTIGDVLSMVQSGETVEIRPTTEGVHYFIRDADETLLSHVRGAMLSQSASEFPAKDIMKLFGQIIQQSKMRVIVDRAELLSKLSSGIQMDELEVKQSPGFLRLTVSQGDDDQGPYVGVQTISSRSDWEGFAEAQEVTDLEDEDDDAVLRVHWKSREAAFNSVPGDDVFVIHIGFKDGKPYALFVTGDPDEEVDVESGALPARFGLSTGLEAEA